MYCDRGRRECCLAAHGRSLAAAAGLALAVLSNALPTTIAAQDRDVGVVLSGVVVDPSDGATIESVRVHLEGAATTIMSAADGTFRLEGVRQGPNALSFQRPGYVARSFSFVLAQDTGTVLVGAIALNPVGAGNVTFRGTVLNAVTNEPVPAALLQIDGTTIGISNPEGAFESSVTLTLGYHRFETKGIGFRPDTQQINVTEPDVAIDLTVAVEPTPYRLQSIEIVGEKLVRRLTPYYFRRGGTQGHFLDPADIEKLVPTVNSATALLAKVPGIVVTPTPDGNVVNMARSAFRCDGTRIYINNALYADYDGDDIDMLIGLPNILAIEVYRSALEAPIEFRQSGCGVIVIWTR